jgi:sugar lactone lactonase YvrE
LSRLDLLAGQPGGPGWVDGVGAAAHFADPWSLASDGAGHLFLADGNMIRAVDLASRAVTTLAGSLLGVGGTDGPGAQASFNTPSGLAFYGGILYLTDTENHTLRKIDPVSGMVSTIAGAYGVPGTTDDVGTNARFREPEGLAVDESGNLYIADVDNNTIRAFSISTGAVTTLAGTAGTSGTTDGVGAAARFSKPKEMTYDGAGNVYVVDSLNQSIRKVVVATATVSTLATFQTIPQGVATINGAVLVSLGDHTLVQVAADTGVVTPLAGQSGMQGFVDGAGGAARFNQPAGLWADGAGGLLVADNGNHVLRKVALAGATVSTYAGAKSSGSADGTGTQARFFAPQGLVADDQAVYVADTANQVIRKVELATGVATTLAGASGQPGNTNGAATDARFNQPEALALDRTAQILYVADSNNRAIRAIDLASRAVTTLSYDRAPGDPFTSLNVPAGLALDGGRLYIADYGNDDVVALDPKAMVMTTVAGKQGVPGPTDGTGGQARFYGPQGIAADGQGNLYVADNVNDTIRKVEIATGKVTTLAGQPQTPGHDDGVGAAARFAYPLGVAVDGVGDLFVADSLNNSVRHIALATLAVTTVIGSNQASGVLLGPLPAQLSQPAAIALTPSGALALISENSLLLAH